jgi:hypothetical protein
MTSRGYVARFEIAAPVEPAMTWPRAGRAGEVRRVVWLMREEDSASMW